MPLSARVARNSTVKSGIAIVNQIALALEQPVYGVGQMAGDLTHPHPVGSGRDPGNLDTSGGQFEKEQNQEALQPLSGSRPQR